MVPQPVEQQQQPQHEVQGLAQLWEHLAEENKYN
jgi:hypothetical protein